MKLELLTSIAGRDFSLKRGDVTDRFTGKEADSLIKNGIAKKVAKQTSKEDESQ